MLTERGADDVLDALDIAMAALHPAELSRPGTLRGWTLDASTEEDNALMCTVLRPIAHGPAPVVTFGVARDGRAANRLWLSLRKDSFGRGSVPPLVKQPPSTPWLASRMEIGAGIDWPDKKIDLPLIADLERCIAWAWLDP